jgi:hypothetical protein
MKIRHVVALTGLYTVLVFGVRQARFAYIRAERLAAIAQDEQDEQDAAESLAALTREVAALGSNVAALGHAMDGLNEATR